MIANNFNQLIKDVFLFSEVWISLFFYIPSNSVLSFHYPCLYTLLCGQSQDYLGWLPIIVIYLLQFFLSFFCFKKNSWRLGWLFLISEINLSGDLDLQTDRTLSQTFHFNFVFYLRNSIQILQFFSNIISRTVWVALLTTMLIFKFKLLVIIFLLKLFENFSLARWVSPRESELLLAFTLVDKEEESSFSVFYEGIESICFLNNSCLSWR